MLMWLFVLEFASTVEAVANSTHCYGEPTEPIVVTNRCRGSFGYDSSRMSSTSKRKARPRSTSRCHWLESTGKILNMKQSDAVQFLYRDLQIVTSNLCFEKYDAIFEEEMQEYFPFNETIMDWLSKLYSGEKYSAFDEDKLSLYYEQEHPFLFVRDLAHINSWNLGFKNKERRDHITGLMFSGNPTYAVEATFCLCRPSQIDQEVSSWFDFKQAMTNLEKINPASWEEQAYKACSLFFLYFHLSADRKSIDQEELRELLSPYTTTIETALIEGSDELKQECRRVKTVLSAKSSQIMFDGLQLR